LILNPQDIVQDYWTGASGLQLDENSNDFYDVKVVRDDPNYCNYIIDCNAYRKKDSEIIGRSGLTAELRLDPCITLWTGSDTTLWSSITINGDVHCSGTLTNQGTIDGDVFANTLNGTIIGQKYSVTDLSLTWPNVTVNDFKDRSDVDYRPSDSALTGNVSINRMLLVVGNLTVSGINNVIVAGKNLPALYVTGDLIIEQGASLSITGLAVVDNSIRVSSEANLNIRGGLFTNSIFAKTAADSSVNGYHGTLYGNAQWSGERGGALRFDGSSGYVEIQNEAAFDMTNQITVCAWVNINSVDRDWQAIITKGDSAWRLSTYQKQRKFHFAVTGPPSYYAVNGATQVTTLQWHHVCGTYDGAYIRLYLDGSPDGSTAYVGGITTNNRRVCIGENLEITGRYWNGWIDDVRVYNRCLSSEEIKTVKDGGTVLGLVAHWKLDAPKVTITADLAKTAILVGPQDEQQRWGQAAGAFFRSIQRQ
jgi:hypothetical protein